MVNPDLDPSEHLRRMQTINEIFCNGKWLTADQVNRLQAIEDANSPLPASEWKRRGWIFGVDYLGTEYFAAYQFDAACQPRPIIREILAAYGEVGDPWKLAAWFHYPNGWLVRDVDGKPVNVAPQDALHCRVEVLIAAEKRRGTYVA